MHDEFVTILENRNVNDKYCKLVFSSKKLSANVRPGQFLNIKVSSGTDPLWRRPFSYYRVRGSRVEVLYEAVGRGTEILSSKKRGDTLQILGPLGKSFRLRVPSRKRIFVAGGVGVPPMMFLGETLGAKSAYSFLIGCKSKKEVLPASEISKVKSHVIYTTDDGSYGVKGFVTTQLKQILESEKSENLFIQTCGPKPMLRAVVGLAREFGVEGEASIDERMACGIGACLGCMVETTTGRKTSCVDGPVFSFSELAENF